MAHTKDIGIAIRDGLDSFVSVETHDWADAEAGVTGEEFIGSVDASDADNLVVTLENGERFRVTITREG